MRLAAFRAEYRRSAEGQNEAQRLARIFKVSGCLSLSCRLRILDMLVISFAARRAAAFR